MMLYKLFATILQSVNWNQKSFLWVDMPSSSSQKCADCTDFLYSFLPSVPIGHHFLKVLFTAPIVSTEPMDLSFCWLIKTGEWLCRSPHQQSPTCFSRLTWIVCVMRSKWSYNYCLVRCFFQNLFKQLVETFSIHIYRFSASDSWESKGCNHTVVLTWL